MQRIGIGPMGIGLIGSGFMGRSHAIAFRPRLARAILASLSGGSAFQPDFRDAARIQTTVDAIVTSARERRRIGL